MMLRISLDLFLLALVTVGLQADENEKKGPALLFNENVQWKRIEFAIEDSAKFDKPAMLFFLKSMCKACHNLMNQLDESKEFTELSKDFVMGRAVDDEIPIGDRFNLDGKYAPRIIFQDSKGNILKKLVNSKSEGKEKHFYKNLEEVLEIMKQAAESGSLDDGFGKDIEWREYNQGLVQAKLQHKPMMVIFHKEWCGACQRLKPKFAASEEIRELSSNFIMVNEEDENIIKSEKFAFEEEYYPKITFLDPEGQVLKDEFNVGTPHEHVKFYYGDPEKIAVSMKRVMSRTNSKLDRGYGKHINWTTYEDGLALSAKLRKPMFLLIHKSYCGACKSLKLRVKNSKEVAELSKEFIMVNCQDDEEPTDDQFDIDGSYVPRIFFLDSNGVVEKTIRNEGDNYKKARYAYASDDEIIANMKTALKMHIGEKAPKLDKGFSSQIEWMDLKSGLEEAHKSHKPLMLIIHKSWCMFSQALKDDLQKSQSFVDLSHRFVMVNTEDDEEPTDSQYDVDGTYSPRIYFIDPQGTIHSEVNNTESELEQAKFFYKDAEEVTEAMQIASTKIKTALDRGFGEFIEWRTMAKGLEIAKTENKPLMVLIHRSWCSACKALKPIMQSSKIASLSRDFVMINLEDDEEPEDTQFIVDGGYYPRLFFLDPEGKVQRDLHNDDPNYIEYKFSYGYEDGVIRSMKRAAAKFQSVAKKEGKATPVKDASPKEIQWMKIKPALVEVRKSNKPAMVMIHRASCHACKAVARMLRREEDFILRSKDFVMIDIEDEVDPEADSFDVDGKYVPRIYFLDINGKLIEEIWNVGTQYLDNKYYYYEMTSIYRSMEKALAAFNKVEKVDQVEELEKPKVEKDEL